MREVESVMIKYVGYKEPSTEEEVELEVLGLRTAVAAAEQRISVLSQSLKLQEIVKRHKYLKMLKEEEEKLKAEVTANEDDVAEAPKTEEVEPQG